MVLEQRNSYMASVGKTLWQYWAGQSHNINASAAAVKSLAMEKDRLGLFLLLLFNQSCKYHFGSSANSCYLPSSPL